MTAHGGPETRRNEAMASTLRRWAPATEQGARETYGLERAAQFVRCSVKKCEEFSDIVRGGRDDDPQVVALCSKHFNSVWKEFHGDAQVEDLFSPAPTPTEGEPATEHYKAPEGADDLADAFEAIFGFDRRSDSLGLAVEVMHRYELVAECAESFAAPPVARDAEELERKAHREICSRCHEVSRVSFRVPDNVWELATHHSERENIICLACFTKLADERGVDWGRGIEFFPHPCIAHERAVAGDAETEDERRANWGPNWDVTHPEAVDDLCDEYAEGELDTSEFVRRVHLFIHARLRSTPEGLK